MKRSCWGTGRVARRDCWGSEGTETGETSLRATPRSQRSRRQRAGALRRFGGSRAPDLQARRLGSRLVALMRAHRLAVPSVATLAACPAARALAHCACHCVALPHSAAGPGCLRALLHLCCYYRLRAGCRERLLRFAGGDLGWSFQGEESVRRGCLVHAHGGVQGGMRVERRTRQKCGDWVRQVVRCWDLGKAGRDAWGSLSEENRQRCQIWTE